MIIPPLPLVDNCLFVDNSFLECVNQCDYQAGLRYLHRRRHADEKAALNYGGAMHAALAHRYTHSPDYLLPGVEDQQTTLLTDWFTRRPNPIDDHRTLELATMTNRGYNEKYFSESFKVPTYQGRPAVELSFAFRLFYYHDITVFYCGRIDLLIVDDEQWFVVDHKTTSVMGDQFFKGLSVSPQMMGYIVGVEERVPEVRFSGFMVNAIRVIRPTKRDGLIVKPDDFQRLKVYIHDGQREDWRENTIALTSTFLDHVTQRGFLPQKRAWCANKFGLCEYFDICAVPRENRALMLSSGEYVDDEWSPLNDFPSIKNQTSLTYTDQIHAPQHTIESNPSNTPVDLAQGSTGESQDHTNAPNPGSVCP